MWIGLGILLGIPLLVYIGWASCTLCGWRVASHDGHVCRRCYMQKRYNQKW